jgi:hypothetical protein
VRLSQCQRHRDASGCLSDAGARTPSPPSASPASSSLIGCCTFCHTQVSILFPKKTEASNLLVPVCASASHVAYATVRMEPQFMILGHAAGVVAAQAVKHGTAVQEVDLAEMHATLLADGALLNQTAQPPKKMGFRCGANTCFPSPKSVYRNSSCNGA